MPHDELEQYLAAFRPLPPDPLPSPVRRMRWLAPLAFAAALALAVCLMPRSPQGGDAVEAPFTLGRANQLLVSEKPWKGALDAAAFAGQPLRHGSLEYLTQEELTR